MIIIHIKPSTPHKPISFHIFMRRPLPFQPFPYPTSLDSPLPPFPSPSPTSTPTQQKHCSRLSFAFPLFYIHYYFLVFLDCVQKHQAFVSKFLFVILSQYFVGACSWDGATHSSELYSSWVCTNTLRWFHYRQSDHCKFTFLALSCFNIFKRRAAADLSWTQLDSKIL